MSQVGWSDLRRLAGEVGIPRTNPAVVDLYLLGAGIYSALQFTRETEQALRVSRLALVLHDDLMVHDYVRTLCGDVRDLASLYSAGAIRHDVYRRIAEVLVDEAATAPTVAFVAHGHPLFLVSATELTLELARSRGLRVAVLPAVSSFDTLLCDLGLDYGYGLQMFDATTLLTNRWYPNPSLPLLVFQLATTLDDRVVAHEPPAAILEPLVRHLLEVYPADHACTVVSCAAHLLERATKATVRLDDLARSNAVPLWKRPTLYVPPRD